MSKRRSPKDNIDAATLLAVLDAHQEYSVDLEGVRRSYINNVWVDPTMKRIIRRYRHEHVRTVRRSTATRILNYFNISEESLNAS